MTGDMDELRVASFIQKLRAEGVPVAQAASIAFARALLHINAADLEDLYWAGRATLVSDPTHISSYDKTFSAFCGSTQNPSKPRFRSMDRGLDDQSSTADAETRMDTSAEPPESAARGAIQAASNEMLNAKRFDRLHEEESLLLDELIRGLKILAPSRLTRRRTSATKGRFPDVRETLRRAVSTGGEPLRPATRGRRRRPRTMVMLLDISGSMRGYSRFLLHFAHASSRSGIRTEVFCFGTRLTRISREVAMKDPEAAVARAAELVPDWEGGTKIGANIKTFIDSFGRKGMGRGAIVLIYSDGMERGAPEFLGEQMARLWRLAHSIVWVNPLKGDPRYRPSARGMAAALPFVDVFLPGHNLASLKNLATSLQILRRPPGVPSDRTSAGSLPTKQI